MGYIGDAVAASHLSGNGAFSARCGAELERTTGAAQALLTHSCTAALEMAALLADVRPGDEVIMPSFTFVSTANAVRAARRGAGVRRHPAGHAEPGRALLEDAITVRGRRAIVPVHYAGVGCEMGRDSGDRSADTGCASSRTPPRAVRPGT